MFVGHAPGKFMGVMVDGWVKGSLLYRLAALPSLAEGGVCPHPRQEETSIASHHPAPLNVVLFTRVCIPDLQMRDDGFADESPESISSKPIAGAEGE